GYYKGGLLIGLRQKDDELIAAVAEGVIDQAELRFDFEADLLQQLASHQVSVRVIDVFKVIQIQEDHAELVTETRGAVDLRLQGLIQMAGIVKTGAVVRNGEFLNLLHSAGVIDGNGSVVAQGMQEEHLLLAEAFHGAIDELDHTQHAV